MPRLAALLTMLAPALAPAAWGDEVRLETGGALRGEIASEGPRSQVSVELPGGGRVVLDRDRVALTRELTEAESEYHRRVATVPDTAQAQFTLAMWCRDHKMASEFRAHLRRVVELDPDHEQAQTLLGRQRHNGRWLTREELMAARGMVRHGRDFRTHQEIALVERKERSEQRAAEWRQKLDRWRRWLADSNAEHTAEALEALRTLRAPGAGPAVAELLAEETNRGIQALLVAAAARIEHPATVQALAELSLNDPNYETRQQCLEHLVEARRPGLWKVYAESLKSNNNELVNRAAGALAALDAQEAVGALIEALVTRHQVQVAPASGNHSYSMNSGGAFSFGGGGPKTKKVNATNPEVRSALVKLTGKDLGFNKENWRQWLKASAFEEDVNLRRDK